MIPITMKRRRFVQAAIALPAGSVLLAQQPAPPATPPQAPPGPGFGPGAAGMDYPKIDTTSPEQAAMPVVRFFNAPQLAALKRLSDLLMSRTATTPGAIDAQVPELLDFWIGKSPASHQKIYSTGLDALNKQASAKHKMTFADLDDTAAAALIEPAIKQPWNFVPPADPLAHFLQEARRDIRTATMNSREYATAGSGDGGRGGRRQGGMGMYWYSLD